MKAIYILIIIMLGTVVIIESSIIWNDVDDHRKPTIELKNREPVLIGKSDTMTSKEINLPKGVGKPKLFVPEKGFIPNAETAFKIAEAVWLPVYGRKIYKEKPFNITLMDDSLWLVGGTIPEGNIGGTVYILLQKKDGKIVDMGWSK